VPQLARHCGTVGDLRKAGWKDWYETVEAEHRLMRAHCDTVIAGGLSMGAILALHNYPDEVSALALYGPSLWLDGWRVPWYKHFFNLVTQKWFADYFPFAERAPWGVKDPRMRALVEKAIASGDSTQAGMAA
jgi:carboxylesterase